MINPEEGMNVETKKRNIADTHTHILPHFDDGSQSSAESFSMLRELYLQGVDSVIMTPHFYATDEEPISFIERREAAVSRFLGRIGELLENAVEREGANIPKIYLGAEVEFFNAMCICTMLDRMCICGTRYLLVEMPFDHWTSSMIEELCAIKNRFGIIPVIAHIERYFSFFNPSMLDDLISEGIMVQSNAESFLRLSSRRRALQMLESGRIHLIGSDCHNINKRAPNMGDAIEVIEKRLGVDAIERLCENSKEILAQATPVWNGK